MARSLTDKATRRRRDTRPHCPTDASHQRRRGDRV